MRTSKKHLEARLDELKTITFKMYLETEGYSESFIRDLLVPMYAVVCTCSFKAVLSYPADIMIDYLAARHGIAGCQLRAYNGAYPGSPCRRAGGRTCWQ